MAGKDRKVSIYAPPRFKATWRKFLEICERDGQSASELIRIWVEGYVARKDPGNPQRPLTAWTPGHPDEEARQTQDLFAWLSEFAEERMGEVSYRDIIRVLREAGVPSTRVATIAKNLARMLSKAGVSIFR